MGKINRIIPFGLWPANWGLTGTRRAELEAEYYYEGTALARKLNRIRNDKESKEFQLEELKLDFAEEKITEEERERRALDLTYSDKDSEEFKMAELELDVKFEGLTDQERDKREATIRNEPWFDVIRSGYNPLDEDTTQMAFELDWNDQFVEFLTSKGWSGYTDDQIVDKWFSEVCRQMVMQDELKEEDQALPMPSPWNRTQKTVGPNGRSEFS